MHFRGGVQGGLRRIFQEQFGTRAFRGVIHSREPPLQDTSTMRRHSSESSGLWKARGRGRPSEGSPPQPWWGGLSPAPPSL